MNFKSVLDVAVKEAAPAAGGVAATGVIGAVLTAPGWLIGLGQAAVVVIFTVKAIDKRLERLHAAVNETRGEVETLRGRVKGLPCMDDDAVVPTDCPGEKDKWAP